MRAAGSSSIRLADRVDDAELRQLYRRCRALLMPGEEDFGTGLVEAQACGAPVIALGRGGALDSVLPAQPGVLYDKVQGEPAEQPLAPAPRECMGVSRDGASMRRYAARFSSDRFRAEVLAGALTAVKDPARDAPM